MTARKLLNPKIRLAVRTVLPIYVLWILAIVVIGMVSVSTLPAPNDPAYNPNLSSRSWLVGLAKWDSRYYLTAAKEGYTAHSILPAFYPLYPALIRTVHLITRAGYVVSAVTISAIAAFFAFLMLFLLADDYFADRKKATLTLLVFAFSPAAFFLLAVYTEALFCALAFTAFYMARRRQWLWANVALGALTATRLPAMLFVGAVFLEYLSSIKWQWRNRTPQALYFLLAPLGFVAYAVYLLVKLHDPLMMFHAYRYGWTYQVFNLNILSTLWNSISPIVHMLAVRGPNWAANIYIPILGVGAWLVALIALIFGIRKWPVSFSALLAAALVMYSINSNFTSVNRYILPLFPIYLLIVESLEQELLLAIIPFISMFMTLLFILFSHGYWAG